MSGISGVLFFGNNNADSSVKTMTAKMAHRGIDGINYFQNEAGNVSLSSLLMKVSPSSHFEKGVYTDNFGCSITADVRIDNRGELYQKIGNAEKPFSDELTDPELILWAYQKWGEDCPKCIIGDYAFVIFDSTKQKMFCTRDHIGTRPLYYYYKKGEVFAFASEIKVLLGLDFVSHEFDEQELAAYLGSIGDFSPFRGHTIYKDIKSARPAHTLTISADTLVQNYYWDIDFSRYDKLKTDEDFIAEFRKTFIEAVRCRVDTTYNVGSHLSGGLDSTSVSCVARDTFKQEQKALYTYHMYVGPKCDEKEYAEVALEQGGFQHQYTKKEDFDFYDASAEFSEITSLPNYFVVTPPAQLSWMKAAEKDNCRVFLTGHEGDTVADYGFSYIEDSLRNEDWPLFEELLGQLSKYAIKNRFFDSIDHLPLDKQLDFVRLLIMQPVLGELKAEGKYVKIAKIWANTKRSNQVFAALFLKKANSIVQPIESSKSILNESFREKISFDALAEDVLDNHFEIMPVPKKYDAHFKRMYCRGMTLFCEILEQTGVYHGYKVAHPFLDRRLMELTMVIPPRLNFNNGLLRGIMRESMRDILPEKVRLRTIKMDFSPLLLETILTENTRQYTQDSVSKHPEVLNWINQTDVAKRFNVVGDVRKNNESKYSLMHPLFRILYFNIFLNNLNTIVS